MNVTLENVAACRRKLKIEIPAEEVAREWSSTAAEFGKFAQIPGFRAGRAPLPILEKRFTKEISAEVQRKLLPQSFREAVAKEKLHVVGMPEIEDLHFERSEPLRFTAVVDVAPEFELPSYKGLKVRKAKVELKDEDVDNVLNLLAEQQATFQDVKDRPLAMGDFAVVSYSALCEGKPLAEVAPSASQLAENKQFWLLMAKDSFLPGFCEPLVGAAIGEKREVTVDFPADFKQKELAGKKGIYSVEIGGMKEKKLPVMDDAFAKSYQADSMAALRERMKENMLKDREQKSEGEIRNQIVEQLLKATTFDLPESLVNAETQQTMMNIVRENASRGVSQEMMREKGTEIFDFAKQSARDKVRASFILNRIADAEKIAITDEQLHERIHEIAQESGKTPAEVHRRLEENDGEESIRHGMRSMRTLDHLVGLAQIEKE